MNTNRQSEETFNQALGEVLSEIDRRWKLDGPNPTLYVETRGLIESSNQLKPDILLVDSLTPPVGIETSYEQLDADKDAINRLGSSVSATGHSIDTCISLHIPERFRERAITQSREELLNGDTFGYAIHQRVSVNEQVQNRRWVDSGFNQGTVFDLASLVENVALPKETVDDIGEVVADRIEQAAKRLEVSLSKGQLERVTQKVLQRTHLKGVRTTMLLWLNALLIQHRVNQQGVEHAEPLSFSEEFPTPTNVASAWRKILKKNWDAIFLPAVEVLESVINVHVESVSQSLAHLLKAVEYIESRGSGTQINIGAEIFPRLSDDRKQAGAYYTQPTTAEMLAHLTISKEDLADSDWLRSDLFSKYKLADLACGTGTLLRAGLHRIRRFHREAGGDIDSLKHLHRGAIETGVIGIDVSPIAAHLSNSSLVAIGYGEDYEDTRIGSCPVGGEKSATGSIELFRHESLTDMLHAIGGTVSGTNRALKSVYVQDVSVKWMLMNPPYSKTTGKHGAFDIGGLTDEERIKCQNRWGRLISKEPALKKAGMAATFVALGRRKLEMGGNMGFVLPLTCANGPAWEPTRRLIERGFQEITAIAVAGGKAIGQDSLSADTYMEEMLLICKNALPYPSLSIEEPPKHQTLYCVTLFQSPMRSGESTEIAKGIRHTRDLLGEREDVFSLPILIGDDTLGEIVKLKVVGDGRPWSPVGVTHPQLAKTLASLLGGTLAFHDNQYPFDVEMSTIGDVFEIGYGESTIGYKRNSKPTAGPFEFLPVQKPSDLEKPNLSLWASQSENQTTLVVDPTDYGVPSDAYSAGNEEKLESSKGHLHYQQGMRWTSQKILTATTHQKVHGGRAWRTLIHDDVRIRCAFSLWSNSTLGMIVHWSYGYRTQNGRTGVRTEANAKVPCPHLGKLSEIKLDSALDMFHKLSSDELLPACQAHIDPVRKEIDQEVRNMLGLPDDADEVIGRIRRLWCAEPSVHGYNQAALKALDSVD